MKEHFRRRRHVQAFVVHPHTIRDKESFKISVVSVLMSWTWYRHSLNTKKVKLVEVYRSYGLCDYDNYII